MIKDSFEWEQKFHFKKTEAEKEKTHTVTPVPRTNDWFAHIYDGLFSKAKFKVVGVY